MLAFGTDNEEITSECPGAPFLVSMTDNPDNELSIIISLAAKGEEDEDFDLTGFPQDTAGKLKDLLLDSYPVYEDPERIYHIHFQDYVIYQCRNEVILTGTALKYE